MRRNRFRTGLASLVIVSAMTKAWAGNKLSDHEVQALLDQLAQRGVIRVSEGKVVYELPP